MKNPKLYYTNARLNGKVALLAGPFLEISQAEACIDLIGGLAIEFDPVLEGATFGVMEVKAYAGAGFYNDLLRRNGVTGIISVN
jgi:hypothetical protein